MKTHKVLKLFTFVLFMIIVILACSKPDVVGNNYIELTTSLPIGTKVTFDLETKHNDYEVVWLDMNNDGIRDENYEKYKSGREYIFSSQTIRIYGKVTHFTFSNLKKIDVSNNNYLITLSCRGELTNLDISKNTELYYLDIPNNNLTYLDVSKNTKLYHLNISGNNLTRLDVSKNPKLGMLDCSDNNLRYLDVSKNIKLGKLDCGNNNLSYLDVSNNAKLGCPEYRGNNNICIKVNIYQLDKWGKDGVFKLNCQ